MTAALLVLAVCFAAFVWLIAWLVVPFVAEILAYQQARLLARRSWAQRIGGGGAVRR